MKIKILLLSVLFGGFTYSMEMMCPRLQLIDDGTTNYDGIRYSIKDSHLNSGVFFVLTIDEAVCPKWVDALIINLNGDVVVRCGLEGKKNEGHVDYILDIDSKYLCESELWIFLNKDQKVTLQLSEINNLLDRK